MTSDRFVPKEHDVIRVHRPLLETGRYEAQVGNPAYLWDHLEQKVSSTHLDFEGAVNRAYLLNRFSTGRRI